MNRKDLESLIKPHRWYVSILAGGTFAPLYWFIRPKGVRSADAWALVHLLRLAGIEAHPNRKTDPTAIYIHYRP